MGDIIDKAQEQTETFLKASLSQHKNRDQNQKPSNGTCEGCGVTIPKKRLEVLPFAKYCIDCQRELEGA